MLPMYTEKKAESAPCSWSLFILTNFLLTPIPLIPSAYTQLSNISYAHVKKKAKPYLVADRPAPIPYSLQLSPLDPDHMAYLFKPTLRRHIKLPTYKVMYCSLAESKVDIKLHSWVGWVVLSCLPVASGGQGGKDYSCRGERKWNCGRL